MISSFISAIRAFFNSTSTITFQPPSDSIKHVCNEELESDWILLPGQESSSTAESRFKCKHCGRQVFRGGWGSSFKYEQQQQPLTRRRNKPKQ